MSGLKKSLSLFGGTALFLNIVIGSGLLILPGLVYKQIGSLSILSWLLCALAALPLLLVFIVLGKNYPDSGGISHYAQRAFGGGAQRAGAFILLGAVVFGLPSIAMTGGYYLQSAFHGSIHAYAALIIFSATLLHGVSRDKVSRILNLVGSSVILVLVLLIVISAIGITNAPPIILAEILPKQGEYLKVFSPFMMLFFAFTGWEIGSHSAEEFKDPRRDFPLAMFLSFGIATAFYSAIAIIVLMSRLESGYDAPFITLTSAVLGTSGKYFVSLVATILIFANIFGALWGVSRLIFSLARDGIFPKFLEVTQNGSPSRAIHFTAAMLLFVLLLDYMGIFSIENMFALAGQNFLLLYGLAAATLFVLTESISAKLLSAFVILMIGGILLVAGIHLVYPMTLVGIALVLHKLIASKKVVIRETDVR